MNKIRYLMFVVTAFLVLALSAMNVVPARADDTTPPPTEPAASETAPEEEVAPPVETPPAEEATEVTEPAQAEEPFDETQGEGAPPAVVEPAPVSEDESATVAEVIESLPEGTELVVLDENDEALPLVTEEAAEVIETADPRWCPVGVAPGGAGCSPVFTKFTGVGGLIEWLDANNPNKAGVIWIEGDYDSTTTAGEGGAVILNGLNYGSMNTFALTINGGWNGGALTTMNPNNLSEFHVPFQITNWFGAITINNILITGATGGAGVEALNVTTNGNITLNNVDVQTNTTQGGGAELNNSGGAGNVVVTDSTFNENTGSANSSGLLIISKGTVTLKNVTANGNQEYGVNIDNAAAVTPKTVTLNGTNQFSYNVGGDGLLISTKGIITINNVTAMGNTGGSGAILDNCDYNTGTDFCNVTSAAGVTIKGTNNFSDNGWDGLNVYSGGVISVSNITANGNGTDPSRTGATGGLANDDASGKGAYLNNYGAATQKALTLTGTNTFNGNASNGLSAISYGLISVSNLTASENGCDLAFEDGTFCAGAYLYAEGGVTQTGYGRFEDNAASGLNVDAEYKGAVILNNLFADQNGGMGAFIFGGFGLAPVNVTINGINTFTVNQSVGLLINTDGIVTLNNLTANGNTLSGVEVYNANGYVKAVTIKGVNTFNDNGGDGLFVETNGAIVTYALTAVGNDGNGASLANCDCFVATTQAVTLNGNNYFDDNGATGLSIKSNGVITVNNLTSTFNGANGAYLDNAFTNPANPAVTVKGFSYVTNNTNNGLEILSNGAVTLANVTAIGNNLMGVNIYNLGNPLKPGNVTITGNNIFNSNTSGGLTIDTYGTVLLYNLTANDNTAGGGVSIDNSTGGIARPVTINGSNMFNNNADTGLDINSLGAIKVNNVMANGNIGGVGNGASLTNEFAGSVNQAITLTGYGIFNTNDNAGLEVNSHGTVTLTNLTANLNVNRGVDIFAENDATLASYVNITITGTNTFNGNGEIGLRAESDGTITLNNITANGNSEEGAYLDNTSGTLKNIALNGVNMFNDNVLDGLFFNSSGAVTLTRVTASNNNDNVGGAPQSSGVHGTALGNITFTCGSLYNNEGRGYDLTTAVGKIIAIKGVFSYGNVLIDSAFPAPVITRTCSLL